MQRRFRGGALVLLPILAAAPAARAEPHLALRTGLTCGACHVNRTGGGERTAYGAGFGARTLPWKTPTGDGLFDGQVHPRVRLGSDLRAGYLGTFRADGGPYLGEYRVSEVNLYFGVDLLPDRLTLYVDERVAPGQATSREAFALYRASKAGVYAKAGRFFLPYGIRLQDDDAATRRPLGFSFDGGDLGIEAGVDTGTWVSSLAATNGTGGGPETDNKKQYSWVGSYVRPRWRVGLAATRNALPNSASHTVGGPNVGFKAGPVVALAEYAWFEDRDDAGASVRGEAAHVEADWLVVRGLNLRVWGGAFDPDRRAANDRRDQAGIAVDWTALPGLQVRTFVRLRDGPADVPGSGDDQAAVEVHLYF